MLAAYPLGRPNDEMVHMHEHASYEWVSLM